MKNFEKKLVCCKPCQVCHLAQVLRHFYVQPKLQKSHCKKMRWLWWQTFQVTQRGVIVFVEKVKRFVLIKGFLVNFQATVTFWIKKILTCFVRVCFELVFGLFYEPPTLVFLLSLAKKPNSTLHINEYMSKSCLLVR